MGWTIVERKKFSNKALSRNVDYAFAKKSITIPILTFELPRAVATMPLLFTKVGDRFELSGLMGMKKEENLFINNENRWIAPFLPAKLQSYPFQLVKFDETKKTKTLLVLEDSKLIVDRSDGEPFFNEDGSQSRMLDLYLERSNYVFESMRLVRDSCDSLAELELFRPYELNVQSKVEGPPDLLEGLFAVDFKKLTELPQNKYKRLRESAAIPMAYAHLYSLEKFAILQKMVNNKVSSQLNLRSLGLDIFESQEQEIDFNFN